MPSDAAQVRTPTQEPHAYRPSPAIDAFMTLRPTDLSLLVSLDALLELKNVTHAARRLHISQPALSSQLARLRVLFDDPLLTPSDTGRGMVATPKAVELAAPLREAMDKLKSIGRRREERKSATSEVSFKIGGNTEAIAALAARLVRHAQRCEFDDVRLRLCFVRAQEPDLLAQFENGELDLLLGSSIQLPPALRFRKLGDDRYVMVQRLRHPRGVHAPALAEYCALQHLVVSEPGQDGAPIDDCLLGRGHRRSVAVQLPHWSNVRDILLETDMVATVPLSMLAADPASEGLACCELPFALPPMPLVIAWHRRSDRDPLHRRLREHRFGFDADDAAAPLPREARTGAVERLLAAVVPGAVQ